MTAQEFIETLAAEDLDELVHDMYSQASNISNGGRKEQINALITMFGMAKEEIAKENLV